MNDKPEPAPLFAMQRTPVHFLTIEGWGPSGEVEMRFKCEAGPGAPCRQQPADNRESWHYDDPDLIDSGNCWASMWLNDVGLQEGLIADRTGEYGRVPVVVGYADGVEVAPMPSDLDVMTHAARADGSVPCGKPPLPEGTPVPDDAPVCPVCFDHLLRYVMRLESGQDIKDARTATEHETRGEVNP